MDIKLKELPTKSAMGEAAKETYTKHVGKSGRIWLTKVGRCAGDHIYAEGGPNSQGFGGATLTFKLDNGETLSLKGPWKSNSDSLFKDTGFDLRNNYSTFVIVSENRRYENHVGVMVDVLYADTEWQESDFDRGERIGKEWANKLGKTVHVYQETSGGSRLGWEDPDKENVK